jgi:hypothetical protein
MNHSSVGYKLLNLCNCVHMYLLYRFAVGIR